MTLPNFDYIFPVQNLFYRNFLKLSYKKKKANMWSFFSVSGDVL